MVSLKFMITPAIAKIRMKMWFGLQVMVKLPIIASIFALTPAIAKIRMKMWIVVQVMVRLPIIALIFDIFQSWKKRKKNRPGSMTGVVFFFNLVLYFLDGKF